jgi:hypothetical protein
MAGYQAARTRRTSAGNLVRRLQPIAKYTATPSRAHDHERLGYQQTSSTEQLGVWKNVDSGSWMRCQE